MPNKLLKKSIREFFSCGLVEINSSKPFKLLGNQPTQFGQSIHGLLISLLFQQPDKGTGGGINSKKMYLTF